MLAFTFVHDENGTRVIRGIEACDRRFKMFHHIRANPDRLPTVVSGKILQCRMQYGPANAIVVSRFDAPKDVLAIVLCQYPFRTLRSELKIWGKYEAYRLFQIGPNDEVVVTVPDKSEWRISINYQGMSCKPYSQS